MAKLREERQIWSSLLEAARSVHEASNDLSKFCRFPDDLVEQEVDPFHVPSAALLVHEAGLFSSRYVCLRDAFVTAGPHARWRETYKGTGIGQDFLDRFGCYCLIGSGGAYHSASMAAWVVYMPAHLYYPWHHHPGEEMYLTLAGEAEFMREGCANEVLREGQTSLHNSNQPHAMQTHDHPVMAYVVWRNGFDTPPVLTPHGVNDG